MPALLLIRHAIAEPRGDAWPQDEDRPLSHRGRTRMQEVARGLAAQGDTSTLVLTSPLLRARETAAILGQAWRPAPRLEVLEALSPGHSPRQIADALRPFEGHICVACVGHEPGLGELAAWLLGARVALPFKKGGVARIDVPTWPPHRGGRLAWFATPRMLRGLG